ncbi:MAG: 3-dehydroquinate synthase [Victivallales bacterium]|nr:3-dehydroquinate synthase [Victivallales bacterium]
MKTIEVKTKSQTYQVRIGRGLLASLSGELETALKGQKRPSTIALVTESNVAPLHLATAVEALRPFGARVLQYVFPAGETSKNLDTVAGILNFLAENRVTRSDLVVALGGGVTGDIAGFAAAIYLRGVRVAQIPTTLLAAIDSSVGGKTGVDLPAGKNLCGAFWQPSLVLCDPNLLATLPKEILHDGVAEAIKYGVISDRPLFDLLATQNLDEYLEEVIAQCVASKAAIVARDEFDRGDRALLNFGHTFAHAIEKCSGFAISHGRAVGIGMVMISQLAYQQGWTREECAPAIADALQRYGLPTVTEFTPAQLLPYLLGDKKRAGNQLTLVIPETLGHCVLHPVPVEELAAFFC